MTIVEGLTTARLEAAPLQSKSQNEFFPNLGAHIR